MRVASVLIAFSALVGSGLGHSRLEEPAGFARLQGMNGLKNRAPLRPNDSFCKGLQAGGNAPTVKWAAGSEQEFSLEMPELAAHNGGSMQASISFDGGKTFKVLKSYIGGFPRNNGGNDPKANQTYKFKIPANTKAGNAIFSWSWSNTTGLREFYQDCAPVKITGKGKSTLKDRPDIYVGNLKKMNPGCTNREGNDVEYPDPGPDVQRGKSAMGKPILPKGKCGPVKGSGAGKNNGSGGKRTHKVVAGDVCGTIAEDAGISLTEFYALNPEINSKCTNLRLGSTVNIRKRSRVMRSID